MNDANAPQPPPLIDPDQLAISAEERRVIDLCNEERAKVGLPPLGVNVSANRAATWKSINMSQSGYFSHSDPNGRTFAQRMHELGVAGQSQRENISAGHRDADAVVNGWMASEGHRANILAPDMRAVGVAVADNPSSAYGRYWTQVFTDAAPDGDMVPPAPEPPPPGPVIQSMMPSSGPAGQGVQLTISGLGFGADSRVYFGYKPVVRVGGSDTSLIVLVPGDLIPVPGPYTVIVMSGGQQSPDAIWTATAPQPEPGPNPADLWARERAWAIDAANAYRR